MTSPLSLKDIFSNAPYRMLGKRLEDNGNNSGARLVTSDGRRTLPLTSSKLRAEAGGGIARVVLEQTFDNPSSETLHVTYKMPLPADGAVSGYEFTIGARTIKGKVEPKSQARETFERAISEGRTAAILEQQRADIFTQEIGNIPAGEQIVARITVDQRLAWLPEGEWELRFPTVIGPRYIGSKDTKADAEATKIELAKSEEIQARFHLEVIVRDELAAGRKVESPSHSIAMSGNSHMLRALEGAKLDRDLVLRWAVARPEVGISLAMARPEGNEPHAHLAYGLVTIVPPSPETKTATVPRDLIVLLDTSGSMSGAPLDQAKRVVGMLVNSLTAQDRIELIEFSTVPNAWQTQPLQATQQTKKQAITWVNRLQAGGATEMYTAIVNALQALRPGAQRQVVLVTDGYIGGEQQIVELLHERLPADCRLHVVGVGSAVNRSLATSLSRAGRGAEILVDLTEDAERATRRLLVRTADPILTNVTVEGSAVVEVAPEHVPDVFAGSPIVAGVKLDANGGELVVRGQLANNQKWERTIRVPSTRSGDGNQAIVALFAREHVADLEMRWTIGKEAQMIDRTIERMGVVFQISTRLTSWVAVDEMRRVDPRSGSRRVTQPHEVPHGTSMASFGLAAPMMPGAALSAIVGDEEEDMMTAVSYGSIGSFDQGGFGAPPPPTGAPRAAGGMGGPPAAPPRLVQPSPMIQPSVAEPYAPPAKKGQIETGAAEKSYRVSSSSPSSHHAPMSFTTLQRPSSPRAKSAWPRILAVLFIVLAIIAALIWFFFAR